MRRCIAVLALALGLGLGMGLDSRSQRATHGGPKGPKGPNVLVVMTDDQGVWIASSTDSKANRLCIRSAP